MASQFLRQMLGGSSRQPRYQAIQDEETADSPTSTASYPRRRSRTRFLLPRQRKVAAILLIIDFFIVVTLVLVLEPLITLLRRNDELFVPRLHLQQDPMTAPDSQGQHKIPRILHQTTPNDTIPEKWVKSQQSCKQVYKDYEYKLWTDQGAIDFLTREYPWYVESFENYAFPIQRADAIRYFVLHHYGGIYLDMDTVCNQTFPMHQVEKDSSPHIAVFKSTLPTGITNDLMITSARHPAFTIAISKLPAFYALTRFWAEFQPYVNIMLSSGPLFLSLVVKDYLLLQPSLPSPSVTIIAPDGLDGYITDLESSTWHRADARALMWLGTRPWTWFALGIVGTILGLWIINYLLLMLYTFISRNALSVSASLKQAKVA